MFGLVTNPPIKALNGKNSETELVRDNDWLKVRHQLTTRALTTANTTQTNWDENLQAILISLCAKTNTTQQITTMLTFISKYRLTYDISLKRLEGEKRRNKWGRAWDRESSPFLIMTTLTCSSPHLGQGDHSPSHPPSPPPSTSPSPPFSTPPPSTSQRWPDKASLSTEDAATVCPSSLSPRSPARPAARPWNWSR